MSKTPNYYLKLKIKDLKKITPYLYEISQSWIAEMRVAARVYLDEEGLESLFQDQSLEQLINVATLPGIVQYALAMPDIHEGYGFPIGGVAAFDKEGGIISPGGVGYDINCGVRLLRSNLSFKELKPFLPRLARQLEQDIPSGVGRGGRVRLKEEEINQILNQGAEFLFKRGEAKEEDLEHTEEKGRMKEADARAVSQRAKERGRDQLGTLGAGNHFLEVQRVSQIFHPEKAAKFNLEKDSVTLMIHCGSRGLGHQVADEYIRKMVEIGEKYKIKLRDRELACAPLNSPEGKEYFKAMAAAANFAWANRQLIMSLVRKAWKRALGQNGGELELIYDVSHNIAKFEKHSLEGIEKELCVHRKGATRAFAPQRREIPPLYRQIGQPVLIPGTMGTASYLLTGTERAMRETFGSTCHGAGRVMSRRKASRLVRAEELMGDLKKKGIILYGGSRRGLAEEAPLAYKDIERVVEVVEKAGLAQRVAQFKPLVVIKG